MTTSVLTADKSNFRSQVEKHQVTVLVLLMYGLTWPFMILEVLASRDLLPITLPGIIMLLQGFMPGLAATIVIGLVRGRPGIRALFGKA